MGKGGFKKAAATTRENADTAETSLRRRAFNARVVLVEKEMELHKAQDAVSRLEDMVTKEESVHDALVWMGKELTRLGIAKAWPRKKSKGPFRDVFAAARKKFDFNGRAGYRRLKNRWEKFIATGKLEADEGGRPKLLSSYECTQLIKWCEFKRVQAQAPTLEDVQGKVTAVLEARGCLRLSPSDQWVRDLMKKHNVVLRLPGSG